MAGLGGSRWLSFHLTQALAGYSCFGFYLNRIGKVTSPNCWWCSTTVDNPAHTLFACDRFGTERCEIKRLLGRAVGPADVV